MSLSGLRMQRRRAPAHLLARPRPRSFHLNNVHLKGLSREIDLKNFKNFLKVWWQDATLFVACLTASRRAANWATPHHKEPRRTIWKMYRTTVGLSKWRGWFFNFLGSSNDFIMQTVYLLRLIPVCVGLAKYFCQVPLITSGDVGDRSSITRRDMSVSGCFIRGWRKLWSSLSVVFLVFLMVGGCLGCRRSADSKKSERTEQQLRFNCLQ